jgi:multiple sugar transport system substrate-binding protein
MTLRAQGLRTLAAAAIATTAVLATACSGSAPGGSTGGTELTVAGFKDPTGNLQQIINTWNQAHPKAKVRYVDLPSASDAQHQLLAQTFLARSSTYDLVVADDTWTDEFASKGWLAPLPASQFKLGQMFPASVRGGSYAGQQYTIPFTASAEFLYYRKDLVPAPPTTWAQLVSDCKIARAKNIGCYAGQFAQYEGLTVNFVSAVASAGGSVLSPDGKRVTVDSPQAAKGLQFLVNGFREGYIPKAAITYQEQDGEQAFEQGKLMFLMNYPFVYQQANTPGPDTKVAGKFGVARIPGLSGPGVITTGGHMMGVSAFSKHRSDAEDFVKFFTSEANARQLLTKLGDAPVWQSLYSDPGLTKQFPFLPIIAQELKTGVVRPRTKNYAALSLAIQQNVYTALQGGKSVPAALKGTSTQLSNVLAGH